MQIEFDPAKDDANIAKHGIFAGRCRTVRYGGAFVAVDDRRDYGEVRFRAFGRINGEPRCLVFIFAGVIRAISYRRAHEREMRRYGL